MNFLSREFAFGRMMEINASCLLPEKLLCVQQRVLTVSVAATVLSESHKYN